MHDPRRSDRIAALLVCAALVIATGGCSEGYPDEDLGLDSASRQDSSADILARLNRMNRQSLTATRWSFSLPEPCRLQARAHLPDGSARVLQVGLLHADVQVKGNVGGPVHAVRVDSPSAPSLAAGHLFEADRWTTAVEYATDLLALQRACGHHG